MPPVDNVQTVTDRHLGFFEWWVALGVVLNLTGQGCVLSFPSSLQAALLRPDSDIRASLDTVTWLGSCNSISQIVGFTMSSIIMDRYGRRVAQLLAIVPGLLGWPLIYISTNVFTILVGRMLCGMMAGASTTLGAIIIGEYSSPENRGLFLNFKTVATNLGITLLHVVGYYYKWREVALFALIPIIAAFLNACTWRESPAWLITKKRYEESERNFYYLRGRTDKTIKEFQELLEGQKVLMANTEPAGFVSFIKKFTEPDFVKPVLIICAGFSILEACGRHTFPAYAPDIIGEMTGDKSETIVMTISMDVITTASATFSCVLVKVMRRRALLLWSGAASLAVLGATAGLLLLRARGMLPAALAAAGGTAPLTLLAFYFVLANLGCTPIPMALFGELLPLRHRGAGALVTGVTFSLVLLVFLKTTPIMLANIHVHGTFAVNAVILAACLLFMYWMLPETKDRTLQNIEDYFNYGRFRDQDDSEELMLNKEDKAVD